MDVEEVVARTGAGARWSVELRDAATGRVVASHRPHLLLPTASVAKVFLLLEVAEALEAGRVAPDQRVRRDAVAPVADSGLWQHLAADTLSLEDAARLVGAVSDNLATNVLLAVVGLEAVRERAGRAAPGGSTLHDLVRDVRTPADPPALSEGCASDWAAVLAGLHTGTVAARPVCDRVLGWLAPGADLSMVAAAFGLDPLAHVAADRGVQVWSKTGTGDGVRADVGLVRTDRAAWSYAALCAWDPAGPDLRDGVLAAMRDLGGLVAAGVGAPAVT